MEFARKLLSGTPWGSSSSSKPADVAREETRAELGPRELLQSFMSNDKLESENAFHRSGRQLTDAKHELSTQSEDSEQVRGGVLQRDKTADPRKRYDTPLGEQEPVRGELQAKPQRLEAKLVSENAYQNIGQQPMVAKRELSTQSREEEYISTVEGVKQVRDGVRQRDKAAEPRKRHEAPSREHGPVREELQAKPRHLEAKPRSETGFQDAGRQAMDAKGELLIRSKASEYTIEDGEHVRGGTADPRKRQEAPSREHGPVRDELQAKPQRLEAKPRSENAPQDTGRQPKDAKRELSTRSKASECPPEDEEQVRGGAQQRDKVVDPRKHHEAPSREHGPVRDELQAKPQRLEAKSRSENAFQDTSQQPKDVKRGLSTRSKASEYALENEEQVRGGVRQKDKTVDPRKHYEAPSRGHGPVPDELQAKPQLLEPKPRSENAFQDTGRQVVVTKRELSTRSKASQHAPEDQEQVRSRAQQRDKVVDPRKRHEALVREHEPVRDELQGNARRLEEYLESENTFQNTGWQLTDANREFSTQPKASEHILPLIISSQTAEPRERYGAPSRAHDLVRDERQANAQRLEEKDYLIRSLKLDIATLQRNSEEQSAALALARHELRSCQSQLDNVQRFISTADTHADEDIIQRLQGLNAEVYQVSMTMADYVAEGFARQSATARRTKERASVGESILATIGQVMVDHLAVVDREEDIALFLQIAFQGYLSHLLCQIVSLWTIDPRLNTLIEGTYRRLRIAETQPISGRWRFLTRTHILLAPVSDPKVLVDNTMTGLSNIVMAAGLVSPQHDTVSKLSSEFGEKILTIVSRAGRFGDMVSGMISSDFEIFAVQPGATFDEESMVDMDEDQVTPRRSGVAQRVLCVSRMGLRKQVGERIITLTKAQVVLQAFLDY